MTEVAVETLRARGEPARYERLLGEVLVGLDRAGQLRRLAGTRRRPAPGSDIGRGRVRDGGRRRRPAGRPASADPPDRARTRPTAAPDRRPGPARRPRRTRGRRPAERAGRHAADRRGQEPGARPGRPAPRADPRRDEPADPDGRLVEIEPGRWWLADPADREAAAVPLADRVEWAVFSLLSTAGPLSEAAFFDRIATLFVGHDLPDEAPRPGLPRQLPQPWRARPTGSSTTDDLLRAQPRSTPSSSRALADGGHRLGMRVWLARREQTRRRLDGELLGDRLDEREQRAYLGGISRASEELADVDCIWYIRGKVALPLRGGVDGDARRAAAAHARPDPARRVGSSASSSSPPERTELVRYKLARSPLLRTALETGGLQHHQVEPPAPVPRRGTARPGRHGAAARARPDDRAPRRADAAVRRLTRPVSRRRQSDPRARRTLSSPVAGSRA